MPLRRLLTMLLFLLLCAAGMTARAAETYSFSGAAVNGCSLSSKTYTCPALLPGDTDKVVISNGYTVTANGDINFGYNQSLSITGNSVLKLSGKLDIGNINPANLNINGATLIAGGLFSMGAQAQTITANIQAGSMNLGTGSTLKITGNVTSTGAVAIASNTTIIGNVGGTTVTTNAPVTITGNVTATTSFTLASGSSVTGNVVTGELSLQAAEAIINGSATVNHATLDWHGRVTDTITCSGGTTAGQCDCVTNNSGYDVRKNANANQPGPYCTGKASALDHFVISHDASGSVCAPTSVSVTACANAACSTLFTGGTTLTLTPASQQVTVGASGTTTATMTMPAVGKATLGTSGGGASKATTCKLTGSGAASDCTMQVGDVGFAMSVASPDNTNAAKNVFFANADGRDATKLKIAAMRYDAPTSACVPLFAGTSKKIALSYTRLNPASGQSAPVIAAAPLPATVSLAFDSAGIATPTLSYPDVGQLQLTASYAEQSASATSSMTMVAAPSALAVTVTVPDLRAGSAFTAKVEGRNKANAKTPSFGAEANSVIAKLAGTVCQPAGGVVRLADLDKATVAQGVETFQPTMLEAGSLDLTASVADYLGSGLAASGTTNTQTGGKCSGVVGMFTPAFFWVTPDAVWYRKTGNPKLNQYYSGEPAIQLQLVALNRKGETTVNYMGNVARDVKLEAIVTSPAGAESAAGLITRAGVACASGAALPVCAEEFDKGAANTDPATLWGKGSFTFASAKTAPLTAKVRATDTSQISSAAAGTLGAGEKAEQQIVVRQGRVRLSNAYGSAGKVLKLPVDIEYWTGTAWTTNVDDTPPAGAFAAGAFAITGLTGTKAADAQIAKGSGYVTLTPPAGSGRATAIVALNLGTGTGTDTDCYVVAAQKPATKGAASAYLRAADPYCPAVTTPPDPWARASFGIFSSETRRIIHTREVFR